MNILQGLYVKQGLWVICKKSLRKLLAIKKVLKKGTRLLKYERAEDTECIDRRIAGPDFQPGRPSRTKYSTYLHGATDQEKVFQKIIPVSSFAHVHISNIANHTI